MTVKFSKLAADVGGRHASRDSIQQALAALGPRADQELAELDAEKKLQMIGHFVRALRQLGVSDASRLEHELYEAVGAAPTGRRPVLIRDAISLITIRNHVHQLTTAAGLPWNEGMQVQSAVSEVARFVAGNGGGRIETEATSGRIVFEVRIDRHLPPISLETGVSTPPWLVGVANLARGFRVTHEAHATRFSFWIPVAETLVA